MTKKQRREREDALQELKELEELHKEAMYHSRRFDKALESAYRILRG